MRQVELSINANWHFILIIENRVMLAQNVEKFKWHSNTGLINSLQFS